MNKDRKFVPYTTEKGVQIGRMYIPPKTPEYARCGSRSKRRRGWKLPTWLGVAGIVFLTLMVVLEFFK